MFDEALKRYARHHHVTPEGALDGSHINVKEMLAVFAGACRWAHRWRDSVVIFITDNTVVRGGGR